MKTERFDKKLFKQEVLNNLKTQFRVELDHASQQQIYQAVAYALNGYSEDLRRERPKDFILYVHGIPDGKSTWKQPH